LLRRQTRRADGGGDFAGGRPPARAPAASRKLPLTGGGASALLRFGGRALKGEPAVRPIRLAFAAVVAFAALLGPPVSAAQAAEAVDAAIVLAADVSRSIDDDEFALQRKGYAAAIASDKLMEAVRLGARGAIALCYVEWAGEAEQKVVVDWTILRSDADAKAFAEALAAAPRSFLGRTAIGSALAFSVSLLGESGVDAARKVIDVSGDGTSNQGLPAAESRDAAVAAGATVNGLAIFNRRAAAMGGYLALHTNPPGGLAAYYRDNVVGGPGAFVLPIDDFNAFSDAMVRKLVAEIALGD
jgi:hypothetical protein